MKKCQPFARETWYAAKNLHRSNWLQQYDENSEETTNRQIKVYDPAPAKIKMQKLLKSAVRESLTSQRLKRIWYNACSHESLNKSIRVDTLIWKNGSNRLTYVKEISQALKLVFQMDTIVPHSALCFAFYGTGIWLMTGYLLCNPLISYLRCTFKVGNLGWMWTVRTYVPLPFRP